MAKSTKQARQTASKRGWWILLAILAALAAIGWYYRVPIGGYTDVATAYSARVACSCHYVAGRSMDDCAKDKLAGMELVTLRANGDAKSVTARFPLIAANTAYYREGYGCVLEKWED
ncbi:hypothetical protein ACRAQ6_03460 [Erythrobacter sp. HA6-11]